MPAFDPRIVAKLHLTIEHCTVCASFAKEYKKPAPLNRGSGQRIMIVGQGPGRSEITSGRAFSGQSGRTLDQWLITCGQPQDTPRINTYTTSIIKCLGEPQAFDAMALKCRHFLSAQIKLFRPQIIITLGAPAYQRLTLYGTPYESALCKLQEPHRVLATPYGYPYTLMPWPHPSGMNRWLNATQNRQRLSSSFAVIKKFLEANAS